MRRGFTMVELVLVIAILGIQALMLGPPIMKAVQQYDLVWSRRQTLGEARSAMDRMVKEIRLIPSSAAIIDISSPTQFQFQYPAGNTITYALSGTTLLRNGATQASNVGTLNFNYYDAAGVATITRTAVRTIQIKLTLNAPSNHGTVPLTTTVFLRNLGTDYGNFTSP